MDRYEATKMVMSRIQSLDPENASKIMGYILIQDQGEKEMIRLAFSPEALLLSYINQAKACLGLSSTSPSNPSTSLVNPRPNYPFLQTSPRILASNNGFHLSNPSSPGAAFPISSPRPISYAAVLNGSSSTGANNSSNNGLESSSLHFYGGNDFGDVSMVDPITSPSGRSDSLIFPYGEDANIIPSSHPHPFHRRSSSVNDAAFLANLEEGGGSSGFGWKPCMYFSRGFCKNGNSCKFFHSDIGGGETFEAGSQSAAASGFDEFLRMKALQQQQQQQQQQRFAFMAAGGQHPFPYNKCMNFLNDNWRNDFSPMGLGAGSSSSSRQIYLTFPADSTFKEEDVSSYFSMFGPVQDVRIPYQQKRMFGFVTFVYPETVRLILSKGNPHFVCDSRVLVKPYKEKGKIPDKKQLQQQHQHLERGEYSASLSPSGIDSRELVDLPVGPRMLNNAEELMLRRKLEDEVELQRAIELQGRRMISLQLMDSNQRFLASLPAGVLISSPKQSQLIMSQSVATSSDQDVLQECDDGWETTKSPAVAADNDNLPLERTESSSNNSIVSGNKHQHVNDDNSYLPESLEHILPDNLFASPTKLAAEHQSVFSDALAETDNSIPLTNTSSNNPPCAT